MKSASIGTATSDCEVVDVSPFGLWILVDAKEYFMDYAHFPWFKEARVKDVFAVEREGPQHLRWPALDVDLTLDSIETPAAYPLTYRS
ncbi:MAG: hypothetical protein E1N59_916 [Puniceicoccaceae bacterium 5H]|nr:MAG: hypothetical protein E1N59_916 [Puniceicoccaceae bacterium 5H]